MTTIKKRHPALFRALSVLMLFAVLTTVLSGCGGAQKLEIRNEDGARIRMPAAGKRKLVAFGDSIAAGYGLTSQSENYVTLFAANIGAAAENFAVSGDDTLNLLTLVSGADERLQKSIREANIIVISIGGNDLLHEKTLVIQAIKNSILGSGKEFPAEVEKIYTQLETNLAGVLTRLTALNPNALILLQTVYNPVLKQGYYVTVVNVAKIVDRYINRLNQSLTAVATRFPSVRIVDVSSLNKDAENFHNMKTTFDIHPTVHGHSSLAEVYTARFQELTGE